MQSVANRRSSKAPTKRHKCLFSECRSLLALNLVKNKADDAPNFSSCLSLECQDRGRGNTFLIIGSKKFRKKASLNLNLIRLNQVATSFFKSSSFEEK